MSAKARCAAAPVKAKERWDASMRLYSFDDLRIGAGLDDLALVDVTSVLPESTPPMQRMTALIEEWPRLLASVQEAVAQGPTVSVDEVTLLAPLPAPKVVVAAPVNYRRHQREMGGDGGVYSGAEIKTIETYAGFIKASSSVIGPAQPIRLPANDRRFDHEAEVGVVIGTTTTGVTYDRALDHVFGYVPLLDITMRGAEDRSYRKSFDTFTPIGPAIVTADEIADPRDIDFRLTVNGELRQQANTRDLIYDIARLVELYSGAMTLGPGDLIASGTPQGVGEITPGDQIELTVEGVGCLKMGVKSRIEVAAV
jgi:2-keto-4-pentenoate hydratase/2-oxohepta-3-ene-1,7-dioic acid hydratase in catechol pathway